MTGRLIPPDGLDPLSSASTDGYYLVQKSGRRFREWYRLLVGGTATMTVDSTAHTVTITPTLPTIPQLLTTEINGVPDLVWDDDNQPVYTEVP